MRAQTAVACALCATRFFGEAEILAEMVKLRMHR